MLFIIMRFLKLSRRDIADRLKQALGIEPVNSLEPCFLNGLPFRLADAHVLGTAVGDSRTLLLAPDDAGKAHI
jgi:hypothetical protein